MADFIAGVTKKRKVDVSEVQNSYIISELSKAVREKDRKISFIKKLAAFLDTLDTKEIIDLTGLISNDYRKNVVHSYTTKDGLEWYEVEAPVDQVYLTPTNEKESAILANLSTPWNLKSLIEKIQKGETEGLEDFVDKGVEITELPIAVYVKREEKEEPKIELIDGIHRTPPALTKSKSETLNLYLGIKQ
ncbi:MAG: hypothetical protein Q8P26_05180 [Candidatus Levybacteria bacterium]|nr:hypothetical protein [Candidatus Levybacteria bacterium]